MLSSGLFHHTDCNSAGCLFKFTLGPFLFCSVQTAVIKVFEGGGLQANELYSLNESIRWLLRTELGSFITEYFQVHFFFNSKGIKMTMKEINRVAYKGLVGFARNNEFLVKLSPVRPYTTLSDEDRLEALSDMWVKFFTEILPTLQAIFYPVQGQEMTVRQMSLLGFRNLVLLKLPVEKMMRSTSRPAPVTQMLLVLQGIHEPSGPSHGYILLERLVEKVISPYLSNYLNINPSESSSGGSSSHTSPSSPFSVDASGALIAKEQSSAPTACPDASDIRAGSQNKRFFLLFWVTGGGVRPFNRSERSARVKAYNPLEGLRADPMPHLLQPEIMVSHYGHESFLAPLIEQEGEAYLERSGGVRRHTVANVQSDIQLLTMNERMCPATLQVDGMTRRTRTLNKRTVKTSFCSEPSFLDSRPVEILRGQSSAEMHCGLTS
ncbi:hypothetical protein DNTS_011323 [Danionella cerebrum]|uniref:Proline-rich protein 5-like n=1 Tax=Danionella cerebrum TaxID=2873325 RepID=A0A553MRW3_9TELE|nr:hypothetical protein DNTS_011323 [Danionella translucida]